MWRLTFLFICLSGSVVMALSGLIAAPLITAVIGDDTQLVTLLAVHRGEELFRGKEKLKARIRGHESPLPPDVVRCANCHAAREPERLSQLAAPHLDRSLLLERRQRRGGPPSYYDEQTFCRLLRVGSDPAYVMIAREMPVYELAEPQCRGLWEFLVSKGGAHAER